MGMYTELLIKAGVKSDLPAEVESVLQFLFNNGDKPEHLPSHNFFNKGRWEFIGKSSSFYHVPWSISRYEHDVIFSRSDLKNYDSEIESFLDWVKPYINGCEGDCIGYTWYEEDDQPKLVVL